MPDSTLLLLLAAVIACNLALLGAVFGRPAASRARAWLAARGREGGGSEPALDDGDLLDRLPGSAGLPGHGGYDRAIRVVSWGFLMSTAGIVAASGLWARQLPAIIVLVAVTGGLALVAHEILPAVLPAPIAERWASRLGALVALGFASVLTALTGGSQSPFVIVFPLIAGGTALAAGWRATAAMTVGAGVGYAVAAIVGGPAGDIDRIGVLVNLIALVLFAFIGSVVRAETRRVRETALRLSSVDSLTGLFNRSYFFAALDREIARSDRSGRGFCLVMLDVDDLKATNDLAGHHAGDSLLRAVADTVKGGVRRIDVAARYAGDEFVALLPETDPSGGWVWAEKIRVGVSERHVPGSKMSPTVSIGVVAFPQDGRTADALMISADRAMYISKRGGKNRVAWATSEPRPFGREPARGVPGVPGGPDGPENVTPGVESSRVAMGEPVRWPGRPVGPGPESRSLEGDPRGPGEPPV